MNKISLGDHQKKFNYFLKRKFDPLFLFLVIINILDGISKQNLEITIFSFLILMVKPFLKLLQRFIPIKMKLKKKNILQITLNLLLLAINAAIIFENVSIFMKMKSNEIEENLFLGIRFFTIETGFILYYKSNYSKIFSLLFMVLTISIRLPIHLNDLLFLFIGLFFLILILFTSKKKIKSEILLKKQQSLSVAAQKELDPEENRLDLDFLFSNISDAIFLWDKNGTLLHSHMDYKNEIKLEDWSFKILRKKSKLCKLNDLIFEILKNHLEQNEEKKEENTCMSFEDLITLLKSIKNESTLLLQSKLKEYIIVLVNEKFILLTVKKDPLFFEYLSYKAHYSFISQTINFIEQEFRTPINCLICMLQLIKQDDDLESIKLKVLPCLASSGLLLGLINDFLDVLRIETFNFHPIIVEFDLDLLLEETLQIVKMQACNRGININLSKNEEERIIKNDPFRIRQIVTNLLSKFNFSMKN